MKGMNIARVDSKGRILIPSHIRRDFGLIEGSEVIMIKDNDELKMFPLFRGMNAKIKIILKDAPGTLSKVATIIARNNCNILMSNSRPLEKNLAEWSAILSAKNTEELPKLKKDLLDSEVVERVKIFY